MNLLLDKISRAIAADIHCTPAQAAAAVNLLEEGATVPFIARYRKEVTGGLDAASRSRGKADLSEGS